MQNKCDLRICDICAIAFDLMTIYVSKVHLIFMKFIRTAILLETQTFDLFTANISSIALGTTLGWTSPAFPKLTNENDLSDSPLSFVPSKEELSWIGSLVALGALFGNAIECLSEISGIFVSLPHFIMNT